MHICDTRCLGDDGHHSWPSPGKDECLCNQIFRGNKVYCPMHSKEKKSTTTLTNCYRITVTDHSPEQGELRPDVILNIEIEGRPMVSNVVIEAICDKFKDRKDHAILVERISTTRDLIYSKEAWR